MIIRWGRAAKEQLDGRRQVNNSKEKWECDSEGRSQGLWSDVILGRQVGREHGCEPDTETRGPASSWNLKVFPRQLPSHSVKVQISIPLLLLNRNLGRGPGACACPALDCFPVTGVTEICTPHLQPLNPGKRLGLKCLKIRDPNKVTLY